MLNSLARSSSPQVSTLGWSVFPAGGAATRLSGRTVRYHEDLLRVGAIDIEQPRSGRLRHRDDRAGGGRNRIEDQALTQRGRGQHVCSTTMLGTCRASSSETMSRPSGPP